MNSAQPASDAAATNRPSAPGKAVVVGGGHGIGAAIAHALARQAWCNQVIIADIDQSAAATVANELSVVASEAVHVDISRPDQIGTLVSATHDAEYLAVAAGLFSASSALDTPPEDFQRLLAVNLIGVFGVAQGYAKQMCERGSGSIVAVVSIAATLPRMRQAAYCGSKAGVRQALRVLGMEIAPKGVRINTVSPGPTDTPMMRELAKDHPSVDSLAAGSPEALRPPILDGRVARPEDIAAATSFLLSPDAAHITLRDLVVDGGELLGV